MTRDIILPGGSTSSVRTPCRIQSLCLPSSVHQSVCLSCPCTLFDRDWTEELGFVSCLSSPAWRCHHKIARQTRDRAPATEKLLKSRICIQEFRWRCKSWRQSVHAPSHCRCHRNHNFSYRQVGTLSLLN